MKTLNLLRISIKCKIPKILLQTQSQSLGCKVGKINSQGHYRVAENKD